MIQPRSLTYLYSRFSTAAQSTGDSARRQADAMAAYVREYQPEIVDDLRDFGVSAFKGKNKSEGALARFLEAVEAGRVKPGSVLLVESLDRLSREHAYDALSMWLSIINAGINIVTLTPFEIYNKADQHKIYLALAIMQRAHDESLVKSARASSAWSRKRKEAAAGKVMTKNCPGWLRIVDGKFEPIPERVAEVQMIYDMAMRGMGAMLIARHLNEAGVRPYRGKVWSNGTVNWVLSNPAIIGRLIFRSGEDVEDYYPVVIKPALFHAVQAKRSENQFQNAGRKGENRTNLFTGVARCGYCGSTMHIHGKGKNPKTGQQYRYLTCANKASVGCDSPAWNYERFERLCLSYIADLDLAALLGGARADDERRALADQAEELRADIASKQALIDGYFDKIESDPELEPDYMNRIRRHREAINAATGKLADLDKRIAEMKPRVVVSEEERLALIQQFQTGHGDRHQLASRVREVVDSISLYGAGQAGGKGVQGRILAAQPHFTITLRDGSSVRVVEPVGLGRKKKAPTS